MYFLIILAKFIKLNQNLLHKPFKNSKHIVCMNRQTDVHG